ncbi:MAG TPA: YceI family protein [Micromonosporaceae bacterium]
MNNGSLGGNGVHFGGRGVSVQVQTSDEWPIPGAVLTVMDLSGNQVARSEANERGSADTTPLPPGPYTAIVTAPGYTPAARTAIVTASGSASLGTIVLPRVAGTELPPAGPWTIDPMHSKILVTARHIGLASVRGWLRDLSGTIHVADPIERSTVDVEIQAESVDTGIKMRDDHLRSTDFLDVANYPVIRYRGTGVTPQGDDQWLVTGELTITSITRPVPLQVTYLGLGPDPWGGTRMGLRATAELYRDDFAMRYNDLVRAGIAIVGTKLYVEMDIEAVQGDSASEG